MNETKEVFFKKFINILLQERKKSKATIEGNEENETLEKTV